MTTSSFRVLAVCTANHCRSPLLEFALRRRCEQVGLDWQISSAGTRAEDGEPAHPHVRRILERHGDDHAWWVSRRLSRKTLDESDLVLAVDSVNRNDVVRLEPHVAGRTFLLLPFADFWSERSGGLGSTKAGDEASQVSLARRSLPRTTRGRDLPDPFRRHFRAFVRTDSTVVAAVQAIVGH